MDRRKQNMRQYIKYMITLAALLTVSMGAWAGDITLKQNVTNAKVKIGESTLTAESSVTGQSGIVTLTIMPDNDTNASEPTADGYFLSNATVAARVYTTETAKARHRAPGDTQTLPYSSLEVTKTANGTYSFTMPASGNVQLEITATASVVALTGVSNAIYTGSEITPGVTIGGNAATVSSDYTIAYGTGGNINAGTVTTTLTGAGAYWGEVKKTFTIQKAKIVAVTLDKQNFNAVVSPADDQYKPTVTEVTIENGEKITGSNITSNFTIAGTTFSGATCAETEANSGIYTPNVLTVTPKVDTNYDNSQSFNVNWFVLPSNIGTPERFVFEFTGDLGYTGEALTPEFTIKDSENNDAVLVKDTHYSIVGWSNNTNVGTASVTVRGLKNDFAGERTETFTITKKEVTVSVTTPKQITYGTYNSEIGVLTYTYSGFVGDGVGTAEDQATALATFEAGLGGSVIYTTDYNSADANKRNVGKYKVTLNVSGLTHDNYSFTTAAGGYADMIEVTKAPLSVTAKDHSIVYGEEPTSTGVIYSGWKYNDNESPAVSGTLTYTSPYKSTTYGDVGSYTLQAGGLTSENYDLTFTTDGVLTVTQKEVELSWSNTPLTYNGNPQAPTASVTAGSIVNSDVIAVTVTGQQTNAGEGYTATASALTGDKAGNYKLPAANTTTFNIGKATGSVSYTTTSVQKLFGDAVFTNPLTLVGDGTVTYTSSDTNVATVDEFGAISITGDGTTTITATVTDKTGGNYHYYTSTTDGEATTQYTLTVGALTIASTNTPYSNVYDGAEHTITVAVTYPEDFSDGGTIEYSDDGGLNWSATNPEKKNVGTYTIYYKLSKTGYTTVTHHSTITITPAPLTITADNKGITYGGALPDYTVTYGEDNGATNNFVGGETTNVLGGTLTYACDYTERYQDRGTGSFTITPSGLTSSNYTITFVPGTLTVAQKDVTLTWGTTEFVCNDVDAQSPYPSFGDGEIVNGDNVIVSIAVTQGTTPVAEPVSVGEYTATASLTGTKADNYKFAEGATTVQNFSIKRQMTGVDFTSKNWVTYYASEDLALPTGITAYRVSAVNGAAVTAEAVDYIKANTGVLLYNTSSLAGSILASAGTGTTYTSLLKGGNFAEGRNYILYGDKFVVYDGTATGPGEYRCYLPAEDATAAARYRSLTIVVGGDGGTTSIDGTRLTDNDNMADADWYDLQGRKLDGKPEKKGLYIMNGKKVVIK